MQPISRITTRRILRAFFLICGLEAAGLLAFLFLIPSDPKNSLLFGFSAARLGIAALLLMAGMASLSIGLIPGKKNSLLMWLVGWLGGNHWLARTLSWFTGAGSLVGWLLIWMPAYRFGRLSAYFERLFPLILWLFLVCLQAFFLWVLSRKGVPAWKRLKGEGSALGAAGIVGGLFLILIGFIAVTRIGLTPDAIHWNDNGVPLGGEQVWLAFIIGLVALLIFLPGRELIVHRTGLFQSKWLDTILFLLIWLIAALLWSNAPMVRSFFAPGPYPPGMVYYPFSDSVTYDLDAWRAFLGEGYAGGGLVDKPLYSFLLLMIHGLAGGDYTRILSLQAGLLAVLPALVYLAGRAVHSRPAGLAAAVLVISRELNAYLSTTTLNTSHSRLLLSEIPTAIMLAAFALCVAGWIRRSRNRLSWAAAAGGILALCTMVRHNPWLLLPFVIMGFVLAYGRRWRSAALQLVIFLAVFIATLVPWGIRTSHVLGNPFYVLGTFKGVVVEGRYQPETATTPESNTPGNIPASPGLVEGILDKAGSYLVFISEHFFHNLVANSLSLPTRFINDDIPSMLNSPGSTQQPDWDRTLTAARLMVLCLNLAFVAAGISGAWRRYRWAGVVPLGIYLVYLLAAAIARTSGGRYIVPVEWVLFLYYAVGLVEGIRWTGIWLGFPSLQWKKGEHLITTSGSSAWQSLIATSLIFLFAGSSLPLTERLFPLRYPLRQPVEVVHSLAAQGVLTQTGLNEEQMTSFLQQPGARLAWGQALYPRFYEKDQGEPDQYSFLRIQPYPRLTFTLGNLAGGNVVLPLQTSPTTFTDGSTVYALGCPGFDSLDAVAVLVLPPNGQPLFLERWPATDWICPLPQPVCDENRNCR